MIKRKMKAGTAERGEKNERRRVAPTKKDYTKKGETQEGKDDNARTDKTPDLENDSRAGTEQRRWGVTGKEKKAQSGKKWGRTTGRGRRAPEGQEGGTDE